MNINQARNQANRFSRALNMKSEGYRFQPFGKTPTYAVFKPENTATTNGRRDYFVNLTPGKEECDCADFQKNGGTCKHMLFVTVEKEKQEEEVMWEAKCAEYELLEA